MHRRKNMIETKSLEYIMALFNDISDKKHLENVATITDYIEEQVLKNLAVFIAETRKKKGLTVRELNERSRVSLAVINDLEKARSMPRVETLIRLGLALEVGYNEVFSALILQDETHTKSLPKETRLAMDLAKYGYDKNQVFEIMSYIEFVNFKNSIQKDNKRK
ncbi:MAG: helix-turn-helix transcriptional regulator [Candidatus Gastranaerophilales bacterium]|nr:helix-turn-helix transcriptional regulator [Candidatus Gastranaerophilales bacterium]